MGRGRGEVDMSEVPMNPEQILANLVPGSARREEAARALVHLLTKLAKVSLPEPHTQQVYFIDPADQEEIVDRALVRILEKGSLPVVGKSDGQCVVYLKHMLARLVIDLGRAKTREQNRQALIRAEEAPTVFDPEEAEDRDVVEESQELLRKVVAGMGARARTEAEREKLAKTWSQIELLVLDEQDMAVVLERDEGCGKDTSQGDLVRARDRVLTQHKRFRERLARTADAMEAAGELSVEEAGKLRLLVKFFLLRRQTPAGTASTES
jgi:hypothetical protein